MKDPKAAPAMAPIGPPKNKPMVPPIKVPRQLNLLPHKKGGLNVRLKSFNYLRYQTRCFVNTTQLHYNRYRPNNPSVRSAGLFCHRLG